MLLVIFRKVFFYFSDFICIISIFCEFIYFICSAKLTFLAYFLTWHLDPHQTNTHPKYQQNSKDIINADQILTFSSYISTVVQYL